MNKAFSIIYEAASSASFLLQFFYMNCYFKKIKFFLFQIDENNLNDLSYQRRLSKMGNSFTSVIESSESSLYNADERRSSSRLGILPLSPLVDDGEDHPLTSSNAAEVFSDHSRRSTVVRIVTGDSDSEDKALMSERSTHHPTYPSAHHNKLGMGSLGGGYERSTPSDFRGLSTFHLYLCCGMMGFVIFWVVLMLRIYLPESYWRWSYFW